MNLTSRGLSTTIGTAPFSVNIGPNGVYRTVTIPGAGISNRQRIDIADKRSLPDFVPVLPPDLNLAGEIRSASTEELTSNSLEPIRDLLAKAFSQREAIRSELSIATNDYDRAREKFRKWDDGFLFKKLFKDWFAERKEKAETAEARWKELQEQFDLSAIRAEIDLDPDQQVPYLRLVEKFKAVSECRIIWNILSERRVNRIAERSNADHNIDRTVVSFALDAGDVIQWEKKIPHLRNKTGGDMYIYPGFVLYRDAAEAFALIDCRDIELQYVRTQFREQEPIPVDSQIIGYTWAKCNKDGSPDRRFRDNYQIPLALYGGLYFRSSDGLDVRYLCSNAAAAQEFVQAWITFRSTFQTTQKEPPTKAYKTAPFPAVAATVKSSFDVAAAPSAPSQHSDVDWFALVANCNLAFMTFANLNTSACHKLALSFAAKGSNEQSYFLSASEIDGLVWALKNLLPLDAKMVESSEFVPVPVRNRLTVALEGARNALETFLLKANGGMANLSDLVALISCGTDLAVAHAEFIGVAGPTTAK